MYSDVNEVYQVDKGKEPLRMTITWLFGGTLIVTRCKKVVSVTSPWFLSDWETKRKRVKSFRDTPTLLRGPTVVIVRVG